MVKNTPKILSCFVDETGDFGEFDSHCPYYMVSVVLHSCPENHFDLFFFERLVLILTNTDAVENAVHASSLMMYASTI